MIIAGLPVVLISPLTKTFVSKTTNIIPQWRPSNPQGMQSHPRGTPSRFCAPRVFSG